MLHKSEKLGISFDLFYSASGENFVAALVAIDDNGSKIDIMKSVFKTLCNIEVSPLYYNVAIAIQLEKPRTLPLKETNVESVRKLISYWENEIVKFVEQTFRAHEYIHKIISLI